MTTSDTTDLLVIGAGAGGMTTALVAALQGMKVILCEASEQVGGTTATSAGTIWIPGNSQGIRTGHTDSVDAAKTYLDSLLGEDDPRGMRRAYLESAIEAIDYLEKNSQVRFVSSGMHPDYVELPGAATAGRALSPIEFDGRRLGAAFSRVRAPMAEFMLLGGMMVGKADIGALVHRFRSVAHFLRSARLVTRYAVDRLRYPRGTRLVMGNALVARLFASLQDAGVHVEFGTRLETLVRNKGRIVGGRVSRGGLHREILARAGVVLATGGVGHHPALRAELGALPDRVFSLAFAGNGGDGVAMARDIGAHLERFQPEFLWQPVSKIPRGDGTIGLFPHLFLDRAKPGLIAVDKFGRRFVNEGASYHHFVEGMLRTAGNDQGSVPVYLICTQDFVRKYGLGIVPPGTRKLLRYVNQGYLVIASTPEELAAQLGIDPRGLIASLTQANQAAADGVDPVFGKGSTAVSRFNGDPAHHPNPCLGSIEVGPYVGLAIWPGDSANSSGLMTSAHGEVQNAQGQAIPHLYACGNDTASPWRGAYPGPGATIGPAMVFGYRIAMRAAKVIEELPGP